MADNLTTQTTAPATVPSASAIATDEISSVHYQRVKTALGPNGTHTADQAGRDLGSGSGAAYVDNRPAVTRIQVSQTTSATAYEAKDAIGGLMTFANAARVSGGSIHIEGATIVDEDDQAAAVDLVLFRSSITAPTDEAAFDPTDAELLDCIGFIRFAATDYSRFNDNSVAHKDCALTSTLSGTSLYGVLMAVGTPTYASTSSIHVTLSIVQD